MNDVNNKDRRRFCAGAAALGLGSGVLPSMASAAAVQPIQASEPSMLAISAQEFWTDKNGVRLWVYRKRVNTAGPSPNGLLFLVHGSSYSGKTMFDLAVPNRTDYSFMDHFARLGFDVWTMDHEGYGHSDRTKSNSDIASGAADLKVAINVIKRETGLERAAYFGQSSGALRAGLFAN